MYVHISRTIKGILIWVLASSLALVGAVSPLSIASSQTVDTNFLNDRAADIISSNPLQVPGLAIPPGLTGNGVIIGLADSGLDKGSLSDIHPDLQSDKGRIPRIAMLKSYTDRAQADDPVGHGTHMAATLVGSGEASDGQYRGIAPGASLYFQALLDKEGKIKLPEQLKDLYGPAYSAGVRIHVNGWGEESKGYSQYSKQIDNFVYAYPDFLPVFGAGNNGPEANSLTSEANSKNALVIGSSQVPRPVFSSEAIDASRVADSSSRGPADGGRIKPDLLAPGSAIISACSRLTTSNYAANPAYTRMGGSSMASAVAGGAAALLQEYLKTQCGIKNPSSALLKALLINGAQTPANGPSGDSGFGILDMANTILPLKEGSTLIASNPGHLVDGQTIEYRFQVADSTRPFKATLAWIDSPLPDGTPSPYLVDNLDLQVIDPSGEILMGNDFSQTGVSDNKNNVEQILINKPHPGNYTIRVHGSGLKGPVWSSHYALVYGQLMRHEVVKEIKSGKLVLASGLSLDSTFYNVLGSLNGSQLFTSASGIKIGSDLYLGAKNLYAFARKWESGGIEIINEESGNLLVEMNARVRQGGFFLENNLWPSLSNVLLNNKPPESLLDIPNGLYIQGLINPQLQTVCALAASYQTTAGVVENLNQEKNSLKLINNNRNYPLAPWTAVSTSDKLLDSSESDTPYGSLNDTGLERLTPSTRVSIVYAPGSYQVQYIKIERNIAVGNLTAINSNQRSLRLENGKEYRIFPGARILKNGAEIPLEDLTPGDKISAVVLDQGNSIIDLQAFSAVVYGRIIYFNPKQGMLYLFDSSNRFLSLSFEELSQVYKNGLQIGISSASPGDWVRLVLEPDSNRILRMDLAEKKQEDQLKTLVSYNDANKSMLMSDGTSYLYSSSTQMTKGGYNITPDLIMPGEKIKITTLAKAGADGEFLARAAVENNAEAAPALEASGSVLNGALIIRGSTTASNIYVFRKDGNREKVPVNGDGSFNCIMAILPDETKIRVLAINSKSGGLAGKEVDIKPLEQQASRTFLDISTSPDRNIIEKLAGKGILYGYADGTFQPQQGLARAEFLTMLGRAQAWDMEKIANIEYFKDNASIPWWALGSVYYARQNGIISGYPEGSFEPQRQLSRSEMVVILARLLSLSPLEDSGTSLPFSDETKIPAWAKSAYYYINNREWLELFGTGSKIDPGKEVCRAEAARFLDRIFGE